VHTLKTARAAGFNVIQSTLAEMTRTASAVARARE
jgi:hypothetical protein